MRPTPSDVHVNALLTNISVAFFQDAANFVARSVFPVVPVQKQGDRYVVFDRGDFNRDQMQRRAPATQSAGGGYKIDTTPSYFADVWALHKDIDDQTRANTDNPLNPDRNATTFLSHQAMIRMEKQWATNYFGTGKWTTDITGGSGGVIKWDDASSTPLEDIALGCETILKSTGFWPNRLVLGQPVWTRLKNHPDVVDRIKGGSTSGDPAKVSLANFAALIEVDTVLVMKSIENTAIEGSANVHDFIGGKKALLCYAAPNPAVEIPSAGYTFAWTGYLGAGPDGQRVKQFRMEPEAADRVEIELAFDMKKVAADLGYFWTTIVA